MHSPCSCLDPWPPAMTQGCRSKFFPVRRIARCVGAVVALLATFGGLAISAGASVSLAELDLSRVQTADGPQTSVDQLRSETGVMLRNGDSLWVDLKNDALEFRATVEPMPSGRGAPTRCRFATANDVREVVVAADSKPAQVTLPLEGQDLLVIEATATGPGECIKIHITSSSISTKSERPEAIGGPGPIHWETANWRVRIDGRSGGIERLENPRDPNGMQWLRQAAPWGTGWARIEGVTTWWRQPQAVRALGPRAMESVYDVPRLRVTVRRELTSDEQLKESYTFENTGSLPLMLSDDALGIRVPLVDSYPGAAVCLTQRCHAHLWMGGASSYVNAMRMGGAAPHLGLALTEGSLAAYSIHDRIQHSNDRGQFVLHPAAMTLAPGQSRTITWTLFWHEGWDDFFRKLEAIDAFVRLEAERYTLTSGESLRVRARANHSLKAAKLLVDGKPFAASMNGSSVAVDIPLRQLGEHTVELDDEGRRSVLRAFVTPPPLELIAKRVRFIIDHQQRHESGSPLDGAYLIYDNETNAQVYDGSFSDHNAARERLGMGVLLALYWPRCEDPQLKAAIEQSLEAYARFIAREVENESGRVFNDAGREKRERMYNYPWVAQFHLAMYDAFGKPEQLRRALEVCRAYYDRGGDHFYCIGMPVLPMLASLERAGWENERKEMLAAFRKHALTLLRIGSNYPAHEVNYEQSIVGPAAQLMLEVYSATHDDQFLRGAEEQIRLLELFNGQQPDYRLHDIAIRHWDDYWFGKRRVYGDTFPQYWSTITGSVFALYGTAPKNEARIARGRAIMENNLCVFSPDGRASCAYVYPATVNGKEAEFYDPWANDQDWALVNWLRAWAPGAK